MIHYLLYNILCVYIGRNTVQHINVLIFIAIFLDYNLSKKIYTVVYLKKLRVNYLF